MSWHATMLTDRDNVATVLRPIAAGEVVSVHAPGGLREVVALEAIPLCHKIALVDLAAEEEILKYGCCIGEARMPIRRGAWVHVHNVVSRRGRLETGTAP